MRVGEFILANILVLIPLLLIYLVYLVLLMRKRIKLGVYKDLPTIP